MKLAPDNNPMSGSDSSVFPTPRGIIEVICGCMFSGKTTAMLRLLDSEPASVVAVFKHDKDRRYSRSNVSTHDGRTRDAIVVRDAGEIPNHVADNVEVVAIDEGHFYSEQLVEVCEGLARLGKRVVVTALDRDMWGLTFKPIERLKDVAGVVRIQRGFCAVCGKPATHTHRKTPIKDRNLVGGTTDFEPRCRECWSPPPEEHINSSEMT